MLERLSGWWGRRDPAGEADRLRAENLALRAEIAAVQAENAALRAEKTGLQAAMARLQARIGELEHWVSQQAAKLAANSRNSSKPPSSDGPATPPRKRRKSNRKRGGQPGHEGRTRAMVPVEQVDEVVDCLPTRCEACGTLLMGEDPAPERRQVIDIPKPRVT